MTNDNTPPIDKARIVAAQWQIRALAKGKPPHIRDAALTAIMNLTNIARGYGKAPAYRVVAEKIEMLKGRA